MIVINAQILSINFTLSICFLNVFFSLRACLFLLFVFVFFLFFCGVGIDVDKLSV